MTDHIRLAKIKQIVAVSKINCEHNHLTESKRYEILDVLHDEDGDCFIFIDDSGETNCLSTESFDFSVPNVYLALGKI